jgi:hypothetical protein
MYPRHAAQDVNPLAWNMTSVPGGPELGENVSEAAFARFSELALWDNYAEDLRTEIVQLIYAQPIYPKNLYLDREPMRHEEFKNRVLKPQVRKLQQRGSWTRPSESGPER